MALTTCCAQIYLLLVHMPQVCGEFYLSNWLEMFWQAVPRASWENPLAFLSFQSRTACRSRGAGPQASVRNKRKSTSSALYSEKQFLLLCRNQVERHTSTLNTRSWQTNLQLSAVYDVKVLTVKQRLSHVKLLVVKNRIHNLGVLRFQKTKKNN